MNLCKTIRCFIANTIVNITLEYRPDGSTGPMMHAIAQLEFADRKLGVINIRVESVQFGLVDRVMLRELDVEPLQCLEMQALIRQVPSLTEIKVLHVRAPRGRSEQQRHCEN